MRRDLEEILALCGRGGALHQSRHLRRAADARAAGSGSPRSASIMCRCRYRTSCPTAPTASRPMRAASPKKRDVARWTRELGMGLTINAPMHRQNIDHLPQIIDFAVEVDAQRIEIAHIQYYAWAQVNRAALIPTREKFLETVGDRRGRQEAAAGRAQFRFRHPRSLRVAAEGLHRRLGPLDHGGDALRQGPALPRGADPAGPDLRQCARAAARRHLAQRRGLQRLSRHGLDEGALPLLRAARDRLRRLPLSGLRDDGRRRGDRPRLPSLAGSCALRRLRGNESQRPAPAFVYRRYGGVLQGT